MRAFGFESRRGGGREGGGRKGRPYGGGGKPRPYVLRPGGGGGKPRVGEEHDQGGRDKTARAAQESHALGQSTPVPPVPAVRPSDVNYEVAYT